MFKKKNKFLKESIFNSQLFDTSKEKIDIDLALKSVNLPEYYFNNYFKSRKCEMFKFAKKEYFAMKSNNYNIFNYFELKNVEFKNNLSPQKIDDIILKTHGEKKELFSIYRFKNLKNPEFQIYVNKESINRYEVIIIDLYHLVIPAIDRDRAEKRADSYRKYEMVKDYNYCLSNLKIE